MNVPLVPYDEARIRHNGRLVSMHHRPSAAVAARVEITTDYDDLRFASHQFDAHLLGVKAAGWEPVRELSYGCEADD